MTLSGEFHFRALENMYRAAPINDFFKPTLSVSKGAAKLIMHIDERFFHAAMAVHGSVYFKVLDDAAFFAANSLENEVFVLTTAFTTYLTRPVSEGELVCTGRVVNQNRTQFVAESVLLDHRGKEIGRGNGLFVRSQNLLDQVQGYREYLQSVQSN